MIMMLNRIYVEVEDGGDSFTAYGDNAVQRRIYFADDEDLLGLLQKCKSFAIEHEVDVIEIPVVAIP